MTPQEQLCKLIELDREKLHLKAELSRVLFELHELSREIRTDEGIDELSVFSYQGRMYCLLVESHDWIGVVPVRDLGAGQ